MTDKNMTNFLKIRQILSVIILSTKVLTLYFARIKFTDTHFDKIYNNNSIHLDHAKL